MTWITSRVCATHRLLVASELDLDGSGLKSPRFMMLWDDLQLLMQHIDDDIP